MSEISKVKPTTASAEDWVISDSLVLRRTNGSKGGLAFSTGTLVLLLAGTLCAGFWLYGRVSAILLGADAAGKLDPSTQRELMVAWLAAAGGVVLVGIAAAGFKRSQQRTEVRWEEERRGLVKRVMELRARLVEKQRIETGLREQLHDLQESFNALDRTRAEVQEELNRIKVAEEVFSHQRRELVRSKDVLEMHVQARTQQLQKLQRAYELILNSAGEGICGLDMEDRVTFVNPAAARMMGSSVEDLVGRPARKVFPHFVWHGDVAGGKRNGEHPTEVTATRHDGTPFGAEFLRTPIREDDRVIGEVLLFNDITERKQAAEKLARKAEELARSNAELEQFAFVASHDLQEPLRKIQAFGDRLKTKCAAVNLDEGRDYLDRMQNAAARMQTLIYDLLTFSRVISRTEPFVPVDLNKVAREVIGDLEVRIEKTAGRVETDDLPTIEADALQIRQLLQNLIGNGLKFCKPGTPPVVRVSGKVLPPTPTGLEFCELTVQDNGIGFEEKYLDKIFAVFQRLHGRQEYEGTGIGLAVCRRIVDRHGGTITARSTPGEGATFIVTLPVRHPVTTKDAS